VLTWICWLECPLGFLPSDFVGVVCKWIKKRYLSHIGKKQFICF
jgi:hypothetical protein